MQNDPRTIRINTALFRNPKYYRAIEASDTRDNSVSRLEHTHTASQRIRRKALSENTMCLDPPVMPRKYIYSFLITG